MDGIDEIAHDDRATAQLLRSALRTLAAGSAGPELKEMATDALAGKADLRETMRHDFYANAMADRVTEFTRWFAQLDDDTREGIVAQVDEVRARLEAAGDPATGDHPDQR